MVPVLSSFFVNSVMSVSLLWAHTIRPKKSKFTQFHKSRFQITGDRNIVIKQKNYCSTSRKTFSYSDMCSLIVFQYFEKFNGQRKVTIPTACPVVVSLGPTAHILRQKKKKKSVLLVLFLWHAGNTFCWCNCTGKTPMN